MVERKRCKHEIMAPNRFKNIQLLKVSRWLLTDNFIFLKIYIIFSAALDFVFITYIFLFKLHVYNDYWEDKNGIG